MSYTPTTWKDGDLVTSAKLNKIEQGIANGIEFEVVNMQSDSYATFFSLNKTAGEIIDIVKSGKHILVICTPEPPPDTPSETYAYYSVIPTSINYMPEYGFQILLDLPMFVSSGRLALTASSLDQYPSYNNGNN